MPSLANASRNVLHNDLIPTSIPLRSVCDGWLGIDPRKRGPHPHAGPASPPCAAAVCGVASARAETSSL